MLHGEACTAMIPICVLEAFKRFPQVTSMTETIMKPRIDRIPSLLQSRRVSEMPSIEEMIYAPARYTS